MSGHVAVTRAGAVTSIGIDRPERRNALTAEMYAAMAAAVEDAQDDQAARVVLFHGTRDAFTAGNDLQDFLERPPKDEEAPVFRFLRSVIGARKPLVAAVNGAAVGIGTTLLLHCDLVYAAHDARFSLPFVKLGLVPEFASSYVLPLLAGYHRAAEMLLLGEPFDAQHALAAGIVTRVVAPEEALQAAQEAAAKLAALPERSVMLTRELMKAAHREAIERQMSLESRRFRELLGEPAAQAALSAFLAKRV
jgi:enoyl-CoA hydratase/carnithine racemase